MQKANASLTGGTCKVKQLIIPKHAVSYQTAQCVTLKEPHCLCGAMTKAAFEITGKMLGMLVTEHCRSFLDGMPLRKKRWRLGLTLFQKPHLGRFPKVPKKVDFQCPHRNATLFRQPGYRPIRLLGQFRPSLNVMQSAVHDTSSIISVPLFFPPELLLRGMMPATPILAFCCHFLPIHMQGGSFSLT